MQAQEFITETAFQNFLKHIIKTEIQNLPVAILRKIIKSIDDIGDFFYILKKKDLSLIIQKGIYSDLSNALSKLSPNAIPFIEKESCKYHKIKEVKIIINRYNSIIKRMPLSFIKSSEDYQFEEKKKFFQDFTDEFSNKNKKPSTRRTKLLNKTIFNEDADRLIVKESSCTCKFLSPHKRGKGESDLNCTNCKKNFHSECLKMSSNLSLADINNFECPYCIIEKNDPLLEIISTMVMPFAFSNTIQQRLIIDQLTMTRIKEDNNIGIVIKCIKLEEKYMSEQTWLDAGELYLNTKKVLEFKPLASNSSLQKRKDEKFFTRDNLFVGINIVKFQINKPSYHQIANVRFNDKANYLAAIYLSKRIKAEDLIEKIKTNNIRSIHECKNYIIKSFEDQNEKEKNLVFDKISISLTDIFDFQQIKIPAKSKYCQHLQCFSLENFIKTMEYIFPRKWKCPICKIKAFDIIIDGYLWDILKSNESKDIKEIIFFQDGTYQLNIEIKNNSLEIEENDLNAKRRIEKSINIENEEKNSENELPKKKIKISDEIFIEKNKLILIENNLNQNNIQKENSPSKKIIIPIQIDEEQSVKKPYLINLEESEIIEVKNKEIEIEKEKKIGKNILESLLSSRKNVNESCFLENENGENKLNKYFEIDSTDSNENSKNNNAFNNQNNLEKNGIELIESRINKKIDFSSNKNKNLTLKINNNFDSKCLFMTKNKLAQICRTNDKNINFTEYNILINSLGFQKDLFYPQLKQVQVITAPTIFMNNNIEKDKNIIEID